MAVQVDKKTSCCRETFKAAATVVSRAEFYQIYKKSETHCLIKQTSILRSNSREVKGEVKWWVKKRKKRPEGK